MRHVTYATSGADPLQECDMSSSPAAAHAIRVLNALAARGEPLSAAAIARELGLPRSTTYRLLTTLAEFAYVAHLQESGQFALGVGAYELAWAYQRQEPLRRVALPVMARLVDSTGHSAHFALLSGKDVLYIIEERAPNRPSLVTDVGVRLPAELTASGRAMLALMTKPQVTALYPSAAVLVDRNGNGPRTITALRRILLETRQRGWAEEVDSVTVGLSSAAVAVTDHARYPVAAVTSTFETGSTTPDEQVYILEQLRRAAAAISYRLDPRPR